MSDETDSLPIPTVDSLQAKATAATTTTTTRTARTPLTPARTYCIMLTGFVVFALVLFFTSMLVNGFEQHTPPTIARRHPSATALPSRRRSFDWTTGTTESSDDENKNENETNGAGFGLFSRRSAINCATTAGMALAAPFGAMVPKAASAAAGPNGLILSTAPSSGLRWADAKVGSGESPTQGSITSIDYSMASTAGRFPSIYSTKNGDEPYRWRLGDGSTIRGIELAVLGDAAEGISPMKPGGIRRVIVPNNVGYNALIGRDASNNMILNGSSTANQSPSSKNQRCMAGSEGSLGPIPPKDAPDGAYQRWYQFYCNPRIPYQPDLVLDIKLYGKRGAQASTTTASSSVASAVVAPQPQ